MTFTGWAGSECYPAYHYLYIHFPIWLTLPCHLLCRPTWIMTSHCFRLVVSIPMLLHTFSRLIPLVHPFWVVCIVVRVSEDLWR
ncbi:hypothetical protein BDW66DRAFT_41710 [Aspergillus desertorum]